MRSKLILKMFKVTAISLCFLIGSIAYSQSGFLRDDEDNNIIGYASSVNLKYSVDVTAYGAIGNDVNDDTSSIQAAINTGATEVFIPDGIYMINALTSLVPKSNQVIRLSRRAVLKVIPNSSTSYAVFSLKNVTNVQIIGGKLYGDRNEHTGTSGEWGFGIRISPETNNISVRNMTIMNFWGDGIYIGYGGIPTGIAKNITIDGVICDNNRRQGMSITHGENITIKNSTFQNTNGTAPQAGIDIEPNPGCYVKNVTIANSQFNNNKGAGISLYGGSGLYVSIVNIKNCVFNNNSIWMVISTNVYSVTTINCKY